MHTTFQESLSYRFHQLIFCMDSVADKAISSQTELNFTEFLVILAIYENPQFNQEEIGNWLNLTKSTVSKVTDKLVKKSFLLRSENSVDRRQKDVRLSKAGLDQLEIAKSIVEKISTSLFEVLKLEEIKSLTQILAKVQTQGIPKIYQNMSQITTKS